MEDDSGWPNPEFEGTGNGDKDSDTLRTRLGRQGSSTQVWKDKETKSLFRTQTALK